MLEKSFGLLFFLKQPKNYDANGPTGIGPYGFKLILIFS
jgi:hypothetical protein